MLSYGVEIFSLDLNIYYIRYVKYRVITQLKNETWNWENIEETYLF